MEAKVTISLSEQGQKDALARGLPAEREQTLVVPAVNGDLQFFDVDAEGRLSLTLTYTASAVRDPRGSGWANLAWDRVPSAQDVLEFLRTRDGKRAEIVAAEETKKAQAAAAENAQRQAMYEQFCALSESEQEANLRDYSQLKADAWPAIAAAEARLRERLVQAEKLTQLRKRLPLGPLARPVQINPDSTATVKIPDGTLSDSWSKHVTEVNPTQRGGYAIGGTWLKCGESFILPVGAIIAVGGKEWKGSKRSGSYKHDYRLFVVAPSGLLPAGAWDGVSVTKTAELLAQTPEERCQNALLSRVEMADKCIAALRDFDRVEFAQLLSEIDGRITAWSEVKAACEVALNAADIENSFADIDSAAAAIVAAGYRELAKKHHPDAGGAPETMAFLNAAKSQLVEILKAVKEGN